MSDCPAGKHLVLENPALRAPSGFFIEVVLAALTLEMDLHLCLCGLAQIHDRLAA